MDADLVVNTVQNYFKVLQSCRAPLTDSSQLPASKEAIKSAIKTLWFTLEEEEIKKFLQQAFISLAKFQEHVPQNLDHDFLQKNTSQSSEKGEEHDASLLTFLKNHSEEYGKLAKKYSDELKSLQKEVQLWEKDEFI